MFDVRLSIRSIVDSFHDTVPNNGSKFELIKDRMAVA
jgi:hypothetical protein